MHILMPLEFKLCQEVHVERVIFGKERRRGKGAWSVSLGISCFSWSAFRASTEWDDSVSEAMAVEERTQTAVAQSLEGQRRALILRTA